MTSQALAAVHDTQSLPGVVYRCELPSDDGAIESIHEICFGPGRFARTAFRLREGLAANLSLSLVAEIDRRIVGSVRLTEIRVGEKPCLLLGPLTVLPELKNRGVGKSLMRQSMEKARLAGFQLVLLVGDLPYYWPFGFRTVKAGKIVMPGPVDPARLLIAELVPGAADETSGPAHQPRR